MNEMQFYRVNTEIAGKEEYFFVPEYLKNIVFPEREKSNKIILNMFGLELAFGCNCLNSEGQVKKEFAQLMDEYPYATFIAGGDEYVYVFSGRVLVKLLSVPDIIKNDFLHKRNLEYSR